MTSDWTTAVTWNTRPSRSAVSECDVDVNEAGSYTFEITPTAVGWYEEGAANYGVQLVSTGTLDGGGNERDFVSRNATNGKWPELTIVYGYEDPRHTTYDLGSFAGQHAYATLDEGRLDVETTDLAIASWGPAAVLSRHFVSEYNLSKTAPGWMFNFECRLFHEWQEGFDTDLVYGNDLIYRDASGQKHVFSYNGSSYAAPTGMIASLAKSTSYWTLTFKDRTVLRFDLKGKLIRETDRSGNYTTYTWTATKVTITAANGQTIQVTLADGKATQATYTTAAGTRKVVYSTTAPWTVTHLSGSGLAHSLTYTISSVYQAPFQYYHYLTEIEASNYSGLAGNVEETFVYTDNKLTEVRLPDYASAVPNYNGSNADARIAFATEGRECTVTRWAAVWSSAAPTGSTGTPITQVFSWNGRGSADGRTNPKSSGADEWWSYTYDEDNGWLLSETSPLGKTRSWTYDSRGNVLTQTDELDHVTTYTYGTGDNRDLPATVTSPSGAVTTYTYDAYGNPTLIQRVLNQNPSDNLAKTSYTYADVTVGGKTFYRALTREKRLITGSTWTQTDFNLGGYAASGAPIRVVYQDVLLEQGGSTVDLAENYTYDAFGNVLTRTDASAQLVETNVYDLAGRVTERTTAPFTATVAGTPTTTQIVEHYSYDVWGHLTESYLTSTGDTAGAKANWQTMAYDASGRAMSVTNWLWTAAVPAGQVQSVVTSSYDGKGRRIATADSTMSGQPSLDAYDAIGNVVASWAAGVPSYAESRAQRAIMPDGETPAFDAVGNALRGTASGDSASSTCTYTDDNRVLRATAPDGTWVEYTYDVLGNVSGTLRSNLATSSSSYDMGGRLISNTAENGLTTSLVYDCLGRPTSAQAGAQTASSTVYNRLGWALASTEADGTTSTNEYDQLGRVLVATVAGQTTRATYDAVGHVTHRVDSGDRWTDMSYDVFGRVIRSVQTLPGSPRLTVKDESAVFDSLGRMVSGTDDLLELSSGWSYPLNTPTATTAVLTVGSAGDQVQTTLTIGADGLESSRQTVIASNPQIPAVLRSIDSRDDGFRPTLITLDAGALTPIESRYSYDAAGRLQSQWGTTGGGSGYTAAAESVDAYEYDSSSGLKISENLCLAAVGTAGTIASSYAYSADGRLVSATTGGITTGYSFDSLGNLTTVSPQGDNPTTLTYDSGNRLQTALNVSGNTYFSWDTVAGRRTSQGPTSNELDARIRYTYTEAGMLATYADETATPGRSATYSYDALGQRTQSVVTVDSQTTTYDFTYSGLALASLEASQSGGTGNDSWRLNYLYTAGGRPYAGVYRDPSSSESPVVFAMVTTDRGDVVELLDAAGNPFAAYRYDAWGNPQGIGNVGTGIWAQSTALIGEALAADIALRQPLRYASYYYDSESGLYYLSARMYDPRTGQFLSRDPIRSDGEETAYQYCGGNPIHLVDASGLYATPYQEEYPPRPAPKPLPTIEELRSWAPSWDAFDWICAHCDTSDPVIEQILFDMLDRLYDEYMADAPAPGYVQAADGTVEAASSTGPDSSATTYLVTMKDLLRAAKQGPREIEAMLMQIMTANAAFLREAVGPRLSIAEAYVAIGGKLGFSSRGWTVYKWLMTKIGNGCEWDWKSITGNHNQRFSFPYSLFDGRVVKKSQMITLEQFGNICIGFYAAAIGFPLSFAQLASLDANERSFWHEVLSDAPMINLGAQIFDYTGARQMVGSGSHQYVID